MAGDMSKWRAAAAKLADSTPLANTAIPTKRSKWNLAKCTLAKPVQARSPRCFLLVGCAVTPARPHYDLFPEIEPATVSAIIAALRGSHVVTAVTCYLSPQQPR